MKMATGQLEDREVIGFNGFKIGKIKDAIFESNNWQITHLDIGLENSIAQELDIKKTLKTSHVLIDVSHVQGMSDTVTLRTTKEDLVRQLMMSQD